MARTQVTHHNVIRIFDIGEADGIRFITMEYVEGTDLRGLLAEPQASFPRKRPSGLSSRHAAPRGRTQRRHHPPRPEARQHHARQPGTRGGDGFRTGAVAAGDGMTQTGAMLGTVEYMSPEQAQGGKTRRAFRYLHHRPDLYELLTGKMPFKADSAIASLLKRTQERAAPVSSHDASIPKPLSNIVGKCMEPDLKLRYQSYGGNPCRSRRLAGRARGRNPALSQRRPALGTKLSLALVRDRGGGRGPRGRRLCVPGRNCSGPSPPGAGRWFLSPSCPSATRPATLHWTGWDRV